MLPLLNYTYHHHHYPCHHHHHHYSITIIIVLVIIIRAWLATCICRLTLFCSAVRFWWHTDTRKAVDCMRYTHTHLSLFAVKKFSFSSNKHTDWRSGNTHSLQYIYTQTDIQQLWAFPPFFQVSLNSDVYWKSHFAAVPGIKEFRPSRVRSRVLGKEETGRQSKQAAAAARPKSSFFAQFCRNFFRTISSFRTSCLFLLFTVGVKLFAQKLSLYHSKCSYFPSHYSCWFMDSGHQIKKKCWWTATKSVHLPNKDKIRWWHWQSRPDERSKLAESSEEANY